MFNIFTGCFYQEELKGNRDLYKIAVCTRLYPNDPTIHWWRELAPSDSLFKRFDELGWDNYLRLYEKQLEKMYNTYELDRYVNQILEINKYLDVILLCYETSTQTCHRHTLAKFLNKHYDLSVSEFKLNCKRK